MRAQLGQWLDLSINREVPIAILVLSRAFMVNLDSQVDMSRAIQVGVDISISIPTSTSTSTSTCLYLYLYLYLYLCLYLYVYINLSIYRSISIGHCLHQPL